MAGTRKSKRKGTGKATATKPARRHKSAAPPVAAARAKPPASKSTSGRRPAGAASDRSNWLHDLVFDAWTSMTIPLQRRVGIVLLAISAAGLATVSAWVVTDSLHGFGHWAERAALRGISVALVGLSLWAVLSHRRSVSRVLVLGVGAVSLLVHETGSAWWVDRARAPANRTLHQLESGSRNVETLTRAELADPYVEAYVVMRDVYWELYLRSDDAMSRYRSYYEDYTAEGTFLDAARLTTRSDLWRSIFQIDDLQVRLQRVEAARPDISDLLLTVNLLDVDAETRAAYADDLRATRESFVAATAAAVRQEREALRAMRRSLEVLLDAEGRYRIENGRLIFDRPDDAARYAGRADAG